MHAIAAATLVEQIQAGCGVGGRAQLGAYGRPRAAGDLRPDHEP